MLKRVPPPPPPGFGDAEYYRLYGRPEEYHKYRQRLAESMQQNAEEAEKLEKLEKEEGEIGTPELSSSEPENEFQNFRVTIDNNEGTPSLSEEEEPPPPPPPPPNKHRKSIKDRLGVKKTAKRNKRRNNKFKEIEHRLQSALPPSQPSNQSSSRNNIKNNRRTSSNNRISESNHRNNNHRSRNSRRRRRRRESPIRGMESENNRRSRRMLTRSPEDRDRSSKKRKKSRADEEKWVHDKFRPDGGAIPSDDDDDEDDDDSHWKRKRGSFGKDRKSRSRKIDHKSRRRSSSSSRSSSYSSDSSRSSRSRSYSRSSQSYSSDSSSDSSPRRRRKSRKRRRSSPLPNFKKSIQKAPVNPPVQKIRVTSTAAAAFQEEEAEQIKAKPDFTTSGKLTEDTNTVNGITIKYSEPLNAKRPKVKWRLYVFKGNEELPILYIHRQSAYLLGRERKVADIPLDHPSCSKQHAVLQYRLMSYTRPDGGTGRRVTPYVIDLNSANGTFLNNKKIESQKYVQVLEKDVLKFGFSSREYVLLHDQSNETQEDDVGVD